MKVFKLIFLAITLFMGTFFYSAAYPALQKSGGKINGRVVNATPGPKINESINITLYQYLKDKEMAKRELQTNSQGNFEIKNLATDKNYQYFISAVYEGVEYQTGPLTFNQENKILYIKLPVYEPTSDSSAISVKMHHVLVDITQKSLKVEEYVLFENRDKKTYTGKRKIENQNVIAEFVLPAEFKNLNLLSGLMSCCTIPTKRGFIDTMPLKPGTREVAFSYSVPYPQKSYEFTLPVQFTTENISFLVSKVKGAKVVSEKLQNEGTVALQGKEYSIFSAKNISPQTVIEAKFVGLPGEKRNFNLILAGIIGALALTGIVYPLLAKKGGLSNLKKKKVNIDEKRYFELLKKELLLDIVDLDVKMERKQVSSQEYKQRREEKKKNLVDITKKLEEFEHK